MAGSSAPPMILVLGMTGVGKSTFICSAGPKHASPAIYKGLSSSQAPVEEFEVESKDGRTVSLVDTPGFNDTERSDRMILDEIIRFLKSRKKDRKVAGVIYLLDASNRDYTPISADKIEVPPSVVLATVQCYGGGPISNDVKRSLKSKYGEVYQEDHFGPSDQYQTAWRIISRVLDSSKTGASILPVIRSLEGILQNRPQSGGKGETIKQTFLQKIFRFRDSSKLYLGFSSDKTNELTGGIIEGSSPTGWEKPSGGHHSNLRREVLINQQSREWIQSSANAPPKDSLETPPMKLASNSVDETTKRSTSKPDTVHSGVQSMGPPSMAGPNRSLAKIPLKIILEDPAESESVYSDLQSMAAISPLSSTAEPNYNSIAAALAHQGSSCASYTASETHTTDYGSVFLFRDLDEQTEGEVRLYPVSHSEWIGEPGWIKHWINEQEQSGDGSLN